MTYRQSFHNALYYDLYIDGLYLLFLCVGPVASLIFMNVRLVQAIRYRRVYISREFSEYCRGCRISVQCTFCVFDLLMACNVVICCLS